MYNSPPTNKLTALLLYGFLNFWCQNLSSVEKKMLILAAKEYSVYSGEVPLFPYFSHYSNFQG